MQIPFLVALFLSKEITHRVRVIIGALLVVVLQALVLTGSRGAWVAVAIGMLIFSLVGNRRAIPVLLAGYLLMPVLFYGFSQERLQSLTQIIEQAPEQQEEPDDSFEYRMTVWRNVGSLMSPPYIWGRGFATSDEAMQRAGLRDEKKSTHSGIIMLAVEMGLIGVGLYIWILVVIWRSARQYLKASRQGLGAILASGFIGAIPVLIICDVTGTRFQNGEVMAFFWLMSGILLRETAAVRSSSPAVSPAERLSARMRSPRRALVRA
jgi:O-antigen ligase